MFSDNGFYWTCSSEVDTEYTKEQNFLGVEKVGISCQLCTTENLNKERTSKLAAYSTNNCASACY